MTTCSCSCLVTTAGLATSGHPSHLEPPGRIAVPLPRLQKLADFDRVGPAVVERAKAFASSILCDVAGRRGSLHGRVQPLHPSMRVAGPAFTVEVRPGDNLAFHVALAIAKPGDVIVVDGKGDLGSALVGDLMITQAQAAGIAGLVVDGAVRDTAEVA